MTVHPETREEHIQEIFQVEHVENKLRESLLRCFGHVLCRPPDALVCKCAPKVSEGVKRGQSRPKITRKKVVLKDLQSLGIHEDLAKDRAHMEERNLTGDTY